jgi:hypothetical protein
MPAAAPTHRRDFTPWFGRIALALSICTPALAANPVNPNVSDEKGNTAGGTYAYASNQGSANTAFGYSALRNGFGSYNSAFGISSLSGNSGNYNTAAGYVSLRDNRGSYNTATGSWALVVNSTGSYNTAVGYQALYSNTTGSYNAALGIGALYKNTTGVHNVGVGYHALNLSTTGGYNLAIGDLALAYATTANNNTAVGYGTLDHATTGGSNTALGSKAGDKITTGSGNILIDHVGGSATETKTIRIGTAQTKAFIAGIRGVTTGVSDAVTVMIDSKGQLGTVKSSARYKEDIHDMAAYSSRLYQLRPVTYRYKEPAEDGQKPLEPGLVAEEVAKVYPDLVVNNAAGQVETVQYHKLTPMLLNEVQQQRRELDSLLAHNAALEEQVRQLQAALDRRDADLAARLAQVEASMRPTYTAARR